MKQKGRLNSVIMDFDLTLVDSTKGATACIAFALESLGLPQVSADAVRGTIGLSLEATLGTLTGITDPSLQNRFRKLFLEKADTVMVQETEFFEGVPETLGALRRRGLRLAIVSTKYRYRIEAILERLKARDLFEVIVGGEDVLAHKPSPEGIHGALKRLGTSAAEGLYVGDHAVDAEAATRASVPFLAVLTGATPRESFLPHLKIGVLDSVVDLPRFLVGLQGWPPSDTVMVP